MFRKIKNLGHIFEAILASLVFGFPARKLIIIGVTGTDGKTTTASLINHVLNSNGLSSGMITTVGAQIGGKNFETGYHTTTPSAFFLQKYLNKAADSKDKYLVIETTSHALDQNRIFGIKFKVGVLTNVTHEHLDYHKNYDNYLATKVKLLKNSEVAVLNMDDASYFKAQELLSGKTTISYSVASVSANFNGTLLKNKELLSSVNCSNYLAAFSVCKVLGLKEEEILSAFNTFVLPVGRQEEVYNKNFKVIIDFAHTPNSFEAILSKVRFGTSGRIIHVFGAAGKRDNTKRSVMGKISSKYSDIIVLTAEDPRGESVEQINKDIEKGISRDFTQIEENMISKNQSKVKLFLEVSDRYEAIKFAILNAKKGDTVLVTGKGHERSMNLGRGEIPWSEHKAVKDALKKRAKRN